jgi:beta-phosphoglucomutase-like phosphatase (HAD superfamily)
MDGTLIDTDKLHYNAYKLALLEYDIELEYDNYINIIRIDDYLASLFEKHIVQDIKTKKNKYLQKNTYIKFIDGAEKLIEWIAEFNINHVVVTNTNNNNVNYFKEVLPTLNLLKNWVTREDTIQSKPDPEPYLYAKNKFYRNEKYIIGFENTYSGYISLKGITSCIYIITEKNTVTYNKMKNEDVYLINSFYSLNNNVPK